MASVKSNTTIPQLQKFTQQVYALRNDRHFRAWGMVSNVLRFLMRGLKGIRKGDRQKAKFNLLIAMSWFMSIMNQMHIKIEGDIWQRFPHLCSYCASCPCRCKELKIKNRKKVPVNNKLRPKTLREYQRMFAQIYPPDKRTLEHAGIHLAEEMGEFSEAVQAFKGKNTDKEFQKLIVEAADLFSCLMGVFNSLGVDSAKELSKLFRKNCLLCHQAPCVCSYATTMNFKS
jgi:NTP pyrophosphatase (non-canonical NTP hydrolase)